MWRLCLLTDRDEMSSVYRGPSIDASYQVSAMWQPCLLMDREVMSNLYRGPPIDNIYQASVHLAKRFQRRRSLEIDQSETRIACGSHVY
jgi:hypothetical protein